MSAYGKFTSRRQVKGTLATTIWHCKPRAGVSTYVTIHHLTLGRAATFDGLVSYLHGCFAEEVERGMTYPQEILQGESYTQTMFEDYFFAGDVLLAIAGSEEMPERKVDGSEVQITLEEAKNGRSWEECVAGLYYVRILSVIVRFAVLIFYCAVWQVKPNYPGRSSHVRLATSYHHFADS